MKVLSLLQPWASLTVLGYKKIETRSWNTKYRGELLIHASAKKIILQDGMTNLIDHMCRIGFMKNYNQLPYGAIIGKVNLIDTFSTEWVRPIPFGTENKYFGKNSDSHIFFKTGEVLIKKQEEAFGDYSDGRYGWLLSNPLLFEHPIPAKGQLNLWNFDLPNKFN
jgi:hypothetical protein